MRTCGTVLISDKKDGVEPRGKWNGVTRRTQNHTIPDDLQLVFGGRWGYLAQNEPDHVPKYTQEKL